MIKINPSKVKRLEQKLASTAAPFKDYSLLMVNSARAERPRILKNISHQLVGTEGRHKYGRITNIGLESDCDRRHKPSKLILTV